MTKSPMVSSVTESVCEKPINSSLTPPICSKQLVMSSGMDHLRQNLLAESSNKWSVLGRFGSKFPNF